MPMKRILIKHSKSFHPSLDVPHGENIDNGHESYNHGNKWEDENFKVEEIQEEFNYSFHVNPIAITTLQLLRWVYLLIFRVTLVLIVILHLNDANLTNHNHEMSKVQKGKTRYKFNFVSIEPNLTHNYNPTLNRSTT